MASEGSKLVRVVAREKNIPLFYKRSQKVWDVLVLELLNVIIYNDDKSAPRL